MTTSLENAAPSKVTIREHVIDALQQAGPLGLTMAAIAGAIEGPWRSRDVDDVVRKLWQTNELGRRQDGTFVLAGRKLGDRAAGDIPTKGDRARRKMDAAVKRVAAGARRDGTCPTCGTQTGANLEGPPKPRRRRRRKPLKEGQPGFGIVCPKCAGPKSKQAHTCRKCGFKRRSGRQLGPRPTHKPAKNITDELLLEARRLYVSGLSIRQVAEQIHPQTAYASVNACKTSLFSLFKTRGWKLRPQAEVTRQRNYKHGRKTRAVRGGEKEVAYRHWLAKQRGWDGVVGPLRPLCTGVRKQAPRKGSSCQRPAQKGSEYCFQHDPLLELERQAHLARMRAKQTYREPVIVAAPFSAWLAQLYEQLGAWSHVGALIGADQSSAKRWGTGGVKKVAVRVVRRSAENAGTTLEAIYAAVDVDQPAEAAAA